MQNNSGFYLRLATELKNENQFAGALDLLYIYDKILNEDKNLTEKYVEVAQELRSKPNILIAIYQMKSQVAVKL